MLVKTSTARKMDRMHATIVAHCSLVAYDGAAIFLPVALRMAVPISEALYSKACVDEHNVFALGIGVMLVKLLVSMGRATARV
jgi:hypothetical protein